MCWIELRFGSFTIYVYKYLRGCLASRNDAVLAERRSPRGRRRPGRLGFLTQRQDHRRGDCGHSASPFRAVFSTVTVTVTTPLVPMRTRITEAESLACAEDRMGTS